MIWVQECEQGSSEIMYLVSCPLVSLIQVVAGLEDQGWPYSPVRPLVLGCWLGPESLDDHSLQRAAWTSLPGAPG